MKERITGSEQVDWHRVQQCFHDALELPTDQRESFISAQLADDNAARAEVLSLLSAMEAGDERFDSPLLDLANVKDTAILPGSEVGMWTVLRKIGEGGMATVYEAIRRDADMPKRAALKTVRTISNAALRARFARERRILGLYYFNEATMKQIGAEIGVSHAVLASARGRSAPWPPCGGRPGTRWPGSPSGSSRWRTPSW